MLCVHAISWPCNLIIITGPRRCQSSCLPKVATIARWPTWHHHAPAQQSHACQGPRLSMRGLPSFARLTLRPGGAALPQPPAGNLCPWSQHARKRGPWKAGEGAGPEPVAVLQAGMPRPRHCEAPSEKSTGNGAGRGPVYPSARAPALALEFPQRRALCPFFLLLSRGFVAGSPLLGPAPRTAAGRAPSLRSSGRWETRLFANGHIHQDESPVAVSKYLGLRA